MLYGAIHVAQHTWVRHTARNHHVFTAGAGTGNDSPQTSKIILASAGTESLELGLLEDSEAGCFTEISDKQT
jgi:hypothetical protein